MTEPVDLQGFLRCRIPRDANPNTTTSIHNEHARIDLSLPRDTHRDACAQEQNTMCVQERAKTLKGKMNKDINKQCT